MRTLLLATALSLVAVPAFADPITYTVAGVIGPASTRAPNGDTRYEGYDGGGYFGPPGGSIAGLPFTATWTANNCECAATTPASDPILDVTLDDQWDNF